MHTGRTAGGRQGGLQKALQTWAWVFAVGIGMLPLRSLAGSYDLGWDTSVDTKLTLNYGLAMRLKNPSSELINGPVEPFSFQTNYNGQAIAFLHTGLPTTINFDDADRNFRAGSLINDRYSAYGELSFRHENYGLQLSGDAFYDEVYHRGNKNDSPQTVNKAAPNNQFTDGTRYYDGQRVRLLEAYGYGDWTFGNAMLDVRIGKHVVAWGESLFFSGIAGAQGTADATKAFVPGAEIKQILLPANQVSMQLSLGSDLSLLGYYKLDFKPNEIFPVGDYFSPSDAVGPGASFVYGSLNPLYLDGCPGLLPAPLDQLCNLGGIGGQLFGAPHYVLVNRLDDIRPSKWGQWGAGAKYQLTDSTSVGLYWLRYNDPNPSVQLNFGYAPFTTKPVTITTQIINQPVPVTYNVKYFGGIDMAAASFSTLVGPFNVAGEFAYRQGLDLPVQAVISGDLSPIYVRGKQVQAQVSTLYTVNPGAVFDEFTLVGEAAYFHVNSTDSIHTMPGLIAVGSGDTLFYNRNSWGFQLLTIWTKRNILPGWDFSAPISAGTIVKGNPEMAGAFGALYGEGDQRLSIGGSMQYLQNMQVGVTYNMFFGDAGRTIGNSTLKQNPYVDRDYVTFNIKYDF